MCGFSLASVAGRSDYFSSQPGLEWSFAGGVALSMSVPGLLQALLYGGSALRLEITIRPGNDSSRWEGKG